MNVATSRTHLIMVITFSGGILLCPCAHGTGLYAEGLEYGPGASSPPPPPSFVQRMACPTLGVRIVLMWYPNELGTEF